MQTSKRLLSIMVLSLALIFMSVGSLWAANGDVVAKVNGSPIYKDELDKRVNLLVEQISLQTANAPTDEQLREIREGILDDLIEYRMLLDESAKQGFKVTQQEVDAQLNEVKQTFANESEFVAALGEAGVTEKEFVQTLKDSLTIQKLLESKVADRAKVTDAEVKAFYDENPRFFQQAESVRASHILIKVEPNATPIERDKKKKEIEEVLQALKNGADFGDMAMKYSADPSKVMGGDLGYFTKGRMVKPFEDAAFALKPGELSGIVETQFGYHIIKLVDYQAARIIPFEEMKDVIADNLSLQKKQEAAGKYIEDLYKKTKIEKTGN